MTCEYPCCNRKAEYTIEWWSLNQHGKNPLVADDRHVCSLPEHIILMSCHDEYGGYPDEINSYYTGESKAKLLYFVKKAMDDQLDEDSLEDMVRNAEYPPKEQLLLFKEKKKKKK